MSDWPKADLAAAGCRDRAQFADFQAVLGVVREARQRQNIAFKEELDFAVRCDAAHGEAAQADAAVFHADGQCECHR